MKFLYAHLLLGPLMLVFSFIYKQFPPKKINPIYGYRTARSMRSQDAWDCANQYCIKALFILSVMTCTVQAITLSFMPIKQSIQWSMWFMVAGLITIIPLTEIHLKKKGF